MKYHHTKYYTRLLVYELKAFRCMKKRAVFFSSFTLKIEVKSTPCVKLNLTHLK